jgi:hypothetical protein
LQGAVVDEVVDLAARLEVRVQGDPRFRPQDPAVQLGPDEVVEPGIADLEEAPDELAVVADEPFSQVEDVQPPSCASPPSVSAQDPWPPPRSGMQRVGIRTDRR